MHRTLTIALAGGLIAVGAASALAGGLTVRIDGIGADGRLPSEAAFCAVGPGGAPGPGPNRSLGVAWSPGPPGTRSYVLIMTDPDVPADLATINAPGVTIPSDAPRQEIAHWVLVDIPADRTALAPGEDGAGVVARGKPPGRTPHGTRGVNDFTGFFAGDAAMAGAYGGYDGPCPPVNDLRAHRYTVRVMALDRPSLDLPDGFDAKAALAAIRGHVLAEGAATGTYALNPAAR